MREQILGLTTPIIALVFAALFLAIWWRGGLGRHVLAFAAGYVAFAFGFIVTHLLPTGSAATFFVTQAFYSLASVLLIWATCERAGRPAHLKTLFAIYLISATSLAGAISMSDDAGPRLVLINAGYAMMFLVAFTSLLGATKRTLADTAILVILALHTTDFMVRPILTVMIEGAIPVGEYRNSVYYTVINMVLMLKTLNTAIVLIGACVYDAIQKVKQGADRDALTGLRNRRSFENEVSRAFTQGNLTGEPISLVVADIDHFKQVNDIWGHQAGDKAIVKMAELLVGMIRPHDLVGRVGGEEFCVLVRHCDNFNAEQLANRIRVAFAQSVHEEIGEDIRLTASFGVATRAHEETYGRLFSRADAALYRAKEEGRNLVCSASKAIQTGGNRNSAAKVARSECRAA